jgi:hypothetical protein
MVDKTGLNWTVVYGVKVSPFYGDCKADCGCSNGAGEERGY